MLVQVTIVIETICPSHTLQQTVAYSAGTAHAARFCEKSNKNKFFYILIRDIHWLCMSVPIVVIYRSIKRRLDGDYTNTVVSTREKVGTSCRIFLTTPLSKANIFFCIFFLLFYPTYNWLFVTTKPTGEVYHHVPCSAQTNVRVGEVPVVNYSAGVTFVVSQLTADLFQVPV